MDEIRNKKWLEWCEGINAHTNISSLWDHLNRARGRKHTPLPNHPDPAGEAAALMRHFKQRRNTNNLPRKTINTMKRLRPGRERIIQRACATPDEMDQPFTMAELLAVLKTSRDTASTPYVSFFVRFRATFKDAFQVSLKVVFEVVI